MQVLLNQRRVAELEPGMATVGEVLDALGVYVAPGEIVTEVRLDGERFSAGEPDLYERRSAGGLSSLALETSSPAELADGLRDQVGAALAVVTAKLEDVLARLGEGEWRGANGLLAELLEELHLTLVLDRQVAELDPSRPPLDVAPLEAAARDLVRAEQAGEAGALAERLRSGLLPLLRRWLVDRSGRPESSIEPVRGVASGDRAG